jgi:hypothetical protein
LKHLFWTNAGLISFDNSFDIDSVYFDISSAVNLKNRFIWN